MSGSLDQFEGKYEILAKIGEGGMGAVYKVRHRLLDEVRVIKVMRPQVEEQGQIKNRFLREARIAVKVRHPNIAQMYDFSVDDSGTAFIVMEYIDGITLQTVLKRTGAPSLGMVLELAQQSLQALAHLHKKGIVHRDISPDNLMLATDDLGDPRIKLIDLGIAKTVKGEHNLTATGVFLGKIRYASPEQFRPQEGAPVDHRADLYSFGVVLYELLTGQHPIKGDSWSQLIAGHLFEKPLDFGISDPDGKVPEELRAVVLHALQKAVGDRFQDARSFRAEITPLQRTHAFDPAELAAILSCREAGDETPIKPGSTQDKINRQFGSPGPTSAPTAGTPPPLPQPPDVPVVTGRLDALVAAASQLVDLEMWAEARVQLEAALRAEPNHERAHELMARIEEAEHTARKIAAAVSRVERLIEEGRLDEAESQAHTAISQVGEVTELRAVVERIERLIGERREAEIAERLERASTAEREGRLEEAVTELEAVVSLDPNRSGVADRLASLREAVARAAALGEVAATVDRMVGDGQLDEAAVEVSRAIARFGRDPDLVGLEERVEALRVQRRHAAAREALTRGQRMLTDGEPEAAAEAFRAALELVPDDVVGREGLREAEEAIAERARQAETERAATAAATEIQQALDADDIGLATARFEEATARLGAVGPLVAIGEEIERRRTVLPAVDLSDQTQRIDVAKEMAAAKTADQPTRPLHRPPPMPEPSPRPEPVSPPAAKPQAKPAKAKKPPTSKKATKKTARPKAAASGAPQPHQRRLDPRLLIAGGVAAVVVVVVSLVMVLGGRDDGTTGEAGEPGVLVVSAVPWGEVVSITGADGAKIELPDDVATPCVVTVEAGSYKVLVRGPSDGEQSEVTVDVVAGETVHGDASFSVPSADDFLTRYGL